TYPARAADLIELYREALSRDAQFASARAQFAAAQERIPQGEAGLKPNISLNASVSRNHTEINEPASRSFEYSSRSYTVQLTQPLYRLQNWVAVDQARLSVNAAEAVYLGAQQELITRVAQAYFDVLYAQDVLAFASAQKDAIAQQLEQARRNFEVGTATIVDTHEAQARHDLAVSQEINAQNDWAVRKHALAVLIGKEPPSLKAFGKAVILPPPEPSDLSAWVAAAEDAQPGVRAQRASFEIAQLEIQRSRAAHYPTLDAVASVSQNRNPASAVIEARTQRLVVQLKLPLYAGGALSSRVREAFALAERARSELEFAQRRAALEARQAYLGVLAGIAQVKALEAAQTSSILALESNQTGMEVGVRINIDVLNAQSQLFATRRDLARARYDTLIAQLRLKAATGSLGENDVQAINALLTP
ncbi:MAG: hypothetical protein RJA24_1556, partial [Pseudomonadota bacterium]